MTIVTQLILILLGIGVGYAVTIIQAILLWRIYRTYCWLIGAAFAVSLGSKQIYGLISLPAAIIEAQMNGTMIMHLNRDQWFSVIWSYITMGLFIAFLDWQRRDLKTLGVAYKGYEKA